MIPFISQLPKHQEAIWLSALNQALPNENIVNFKDIAPAEKKHCQFAIVANPKTEVLAEFEHLTWLQSVWAGVDQLMTALLGSPIEIVRLVDPRLSETMAEAVLAWSLYLHREMPKYAKQQQNKLWQQLPYVSASERRIGVLGLGALGQQSAKQLQNHGFKVMGWSRSAKTLASISTYSGEQGLRQMLAQSDILVCLLPLTAVTHGLINKALLEQLPKGSSLINFARGAIVNTEDLLNALNCEHINHAVLDVFEQEPLLSSSELWQHPNITILPHISAPTTIDTACQIVAKNIAHYRQTGELPRCVDKTIGY